MSRYSVIVNGVAKTTTYADLSDAQEHAALTLIYRPNAEVVIFDSTNGNTVK